MICCNAKAENNLRYIIVFHEMNDTPVVGLWEGGLLRVEGGQVLLLGAPARVFRNGQQPLDVAAGSRLDLSSF